MKFLIFLVLLAPILSVKCLKLLMVFHMAAPSHYILGNALAKGLANAGHEVTMVGAFSEKNPPENYKEIVLDGVLEQRNAIDIPNFFELEGKSPISTLLFLNDVSNRFVEGLFQEPKFQALLRSKEHFDAVIIEQFLNDATKILAYHFEAPLILFSTVGSTKWVNIPAGNPEPPSYVPDMFMAPSDQMSFLERTCNFLFGIVTELNLKLYFYPKQEAIMKKYYPGAPDLDDLLYNASLILLNSHESISKPVPRVPNMIDVGGYHVDPPKDLPADLQEFMDNATEGVIYFSMGSNLIPSQMPEETRKVLLKVLGARKERVLWKWDEDDLPDKPGNMKVSKWFPQQAILAHPNTKLFITHGGLLSTTETVVCGVPVLAFPILGDQMLNALRAASLGFGLTLKFSQINENNLAENLNELLENPKYRENAKYRSKLIQDRPVKPMDLAIYWIEYVVRHKGAPHLRVAGIRLPFYKYLMLDVIAVLFGGFVFVTYLLLKLWNILCRRFERTKRKRSEKKQQ